jgi:hypothetical protein
MPEHPAYGDWRDMTIAEGVVELRKLLTRLLLWLKLIEHREDDGGDQH